VLQAFNFDPAHPYAAGQHRGIDIGASAVGDPVTAPESGAVTFAGSVPTSGKSLTIQTPDGYSVTLTHLGSIGVAKGSTVAEGAVVGTVGPSGTPEQASPYVHLGIRQAGDPNGYLDPLGLLPALASPPPGSTGGSSASAGAEGGTSSAPAPAPAPASNPAPVAATPPAAAAGAGLVVRSRPAAPQAAPTKPRLATREHRVQTRRHRAHSRTRPSAEPVGEPVAEPAPLRRRLEEPSRGHPAGPAAPAAPVAARPAPVLLPLAVGAGPGVFAALAALATALARRRHRRRPPAEVLRHPRCAVPPGERGLRRAA
jgi:pyruvate/2-oxoglutarate dehydrogenase complex dihydrolipoamide acyltransferase (E2) component